MYAGARASRLAGGAVSNSSADMELVTGLTTLRGRSRQLVRDASYAKRAKVVIQNNVIGSGIGLQAQVKSTRGELNAAVNDAIEELFRDWSTAENCHTGGELHFHDLERAAMGQIFEAGEVFIRKHRRPFGASAVPLALELIEAERIADELSPSPTVPGNMVRMGVEVDEFYRPVAYFIRPRHQGEFRLGVARSDLVERVPASEIYHLRIIERWPQTRGEPWLHTVIRRLQDMDGYSEAEIVAARGAASYMAAIETPDDNSPLVEKKEDGSREITIEPGITVRLAPGEKFNFVSPNRPNPNMDPFMRMMLREVSAGTGPSYESISRDYSQSNYSASRLGLLDDRDLWRYFQLWFMRAFRLPFHLEWLQAAALSRALAAIPLEAYASDIRRYQAVRFKPRGWTWIDPTKEVEAFIKAVRAGFTTVDDVIAHSGDGKDLEDVIEGRRRELDLMHEKQLEFDTDPARAADGRPKDSPKQRTPASPPAQQQEEGDDQQPGRGIRRVV